MLLGFVPLSPASPVPYPQAIPLETVKALWDTSDRLSIFNVETVNSTVRFGISYWLNADANMRDTLLARFR